MCTCTLYICIKIHVFDHVCVCVDMNVHVSYYHMNNVTYYVQCIKPCVNTCQHDLCIICELIVHLNVVLMAALLAMYL